MSKIVYKVILDNNEIASFDQLEYAMIFIQGMCERYYAELKAGFNFTIKEVQE